MRCFAHLGRNDNDTAAKIALGLMHLGKQGSVTPDSRLISTLQDLLGNKRALSHAAVWAIFWLIAGENYELKREEASKLQAYCKSEYVDAEAIYWVKLISSKFENRVGFSS